MDNIVVMGIGLYDADTKEKRSITETLTVKPSDKDTILLNQGQNISDFYLSLRYQTGVDIFLLNFANTKGQQATDTLIINHTSTPHFESPDCPTTVFHRINKVSWSSHQLAKIPITIDSVEISDPNVEYEDRENIKIYLRSVSR